jgi:hypothetical protein
VIVRDATSFDAENGAGFVNLYSKIVVRNISCASIDVKRRGLMTDKRTGGVTKKCSQPGCPREVYALELCNAHYRRAYYWKKKGTKNPRINRPFRQERVPGDVWLPGARVPKTVMDGLKKEAMTLKMDLTPFIQTLLIALSKSPATVRALLPRDTAKSP